MRLDAVYNNNGIRFSRLFVNVNRHPIRQPAQFNRFQAGDDWRSQAGFSHTQVSKHLALAFSGCSAMAAHCRNDKRLRTMLPQPVYHRAQDFRNLADPPAAGCNRNSFPVKRNRQLTKRIDRLVYRLGHISDAGSKGNPLVLAENAGVVPATQKLW